MQIFPNILIILGDCTLLFGFSKGMVNPGDNVTNTLKAEFGEEALNSLEATEQEKKKINSFIDELFAHGEMVYWKFMLNLN